jgi:hypothetical protein
MRCGRSSPQVDEIVQEIVTAVKLQFTVWEQGWTVRKRTDNLEANGASLLYVQHAMGHHSAAFTLQVYGHLQRNGEQKEVDKLDEAILHVSKRTQDGPINLNVVSKIS